MNCTQARAGSHYVQPVGPYYLPVTNDHLSPKYCVGEMVIADPKKPIKHNDYAVYWINQTEYTIAKCASIKPIDAGIINRVLKILGIARANYIAAHKIIGCIEITPPHATRI